MAAQGLIEFMSELRQEKLSTTSTTFENKEMNETNKETNVVSHQSVAHFKRILWILQNPKKAKKIGPDFVFITDWEMRTNVILDTRAWNMYNN